MSCYRCSGLAAAGLTLLITACVVGAQPRQAVPLKSVVLSDVQGLFGGQDLWATQDGTAYVRTAGRPPAGQSGGMWERRSRVALTAAQWAQLERLVGAHGLLTLKIPQRAGVPDEAHPTITVVTRSGTKASVGKWANDKNDDFDPVYDYLLWLCKTSGEILREGPYDWKWHPDGFDE